jgi:hypothetical protein
MNTTNQSAVTIEVTTVPAGKAPADVSQALMKTWLQAVNDRQSASGGTENASLASLVEEASVGALPQSMQAQLLQDRFRQAFDENGNGGALSDLLGGEAAEGPQGAVENSLEQRVSRQQDADDDLAGENAARAEVAEKSGQNAVGEAESALSIEGDEDLDTVETIDTIDAEELLNHVGRTQEASMPQDAKGPASTPPPRDATDYQWIEKFTDRMLIEVEARAADRNVSVQLSQDLIPNAVLTLSRTNGRWQLSADTTDELAAAGIEDAEAVLLARFAARGLGDIEVNVSRDRVSAYA